MSAASFDEWAISRYGKGFMPERSVFDEGDMRQAYAAGGTRAAPPSEAEAYDEFTRYYWAKGKEWWVDPNRNVGGSDFRNFFIGGYLAALDKAHANYDEWELDALRHGLFSPEYNPNHAVVLTGEDRNRLRAAYMAGMRRVIEYRYSAYISWRQDPQNNKEIRKLRERLGQHDSGIAPLEILMHTAYMAGSSHSCIAHDAMNEYEQVHTDFVNAVLGNAPGTYDRDIAAEEIALEYLRDLEELRDTIVEGLPPAVYMFVSDPNYSPDRVRELRERELDAADRAYHEKYTAVPPRIPYAQDIQLPEPKSKDVQDKGADGEH